MSSANSFGHLFKISSFGESHGPAMGVLIEGCPSGVPFDETLLRHWLERRRPGRDPGLSARSETDAHEILSGVYLGKTLGTPIAIIVKNQNFISSDYDEIKTSIRQGHADDVWKQKFSHSDHRGGGRSSGRETVARVMGGAVAEMFLKQEIGSLRISAVPRQIGHQIINDESLDLHQPLNWYLSEQRKKEVDLMLEGLKAEGESVGGIVEMQIDGAPSGLGQPVFRKLKSELGAAYLSIGATTGVEIGEGFRMIDKMGTQVHRGSTEVYGGIRGGISTGENIRARVAIKPTSSILDVAKKGRHDPCIMFRALPVLEAMTYLVIADQVLWSRLDRAWAGDSR